MKSRIYIIVAFYLIACTAAYSATAPAQATDAQLKAAFLYNFVIFSDWPAGKIAESNEIIIGIIGEHAFGNSFDAVKSKQVKEKKLLIKIFGSFDKIQQNGKQENLEAIEQLKKCHLLFICDSERKYYNEIINVIKKANVMTVGETEDFINFGGIITFIPNTEKMVFEINHTAAKEAKIRISSRVLRLARKVIGGESAYQLEVNETYARFISSAGR